MELLLQRHYHPLGTNGILWHENKILCYTIELPWLQNQRMVSCIPEGRYQLLERYSEKHQSHLMVKGVPDRTLILIHRANNAAKELKGCIAPVSDLTAPGMGKGSVRAFSILMRLVFKSVTHEQPVWLEIGKLPADFSHVKFNY
ncbi:DUF5675 family protein [Flavihumibacter sp. UBA7668]|uniref:DUF5675 family protein n=1 Tax=Flavihumibacter sp. UBA7668 TaxID=1946542 RepID=UPI0025BB69DE|nr:DUF5675 family protein [Flavihumibacter sp. UBA7668]